MSKRNKGFTMVEILVVVGLIAILGVIAVIAFGNIQVGVRRSAVAADARSLASMINTVNVLASGNRIEQTALNGVTGTAGATHAMTVLNANASMPATDLVVPAGARAVAVAGAVTIAAGGNASVNQTFVDGLTDADMAQTGGDFTFRVQATVGSTPP